ncbi:MAG TPA: hypothetical protein VGM67_02020 [Gemmatimonadaceae bacterium]|jgi:hypothetical protein
MARSPDVTAAPAADATEPRFATAWATLVYIVSTMLLAYPALAGQFLLNPRSDQYKAGYAFREYAAQSLRSGHGFPQWNPFIMGGLPYIAAMHGDIFYPTFLLRMIVPTDIAMTWEFPIHLVLCGLFTYLFLRAWGFGFWGALVGGLAYLLGGSIAGYAGPGHDGKLFVSTMLPATLLLLTRGIRDGRHWAWGAFAIVLGLAVLSPHPQLMQYMLLADGAFALWVAFADHPGYGKLPSATAIRRLACSAGGVIIGLLIGAVQFWPALVEYKSWSPRAAGHDWATATSYSFPIEETINSYWPQFSGILDNYWGRNTIHFHSDYVGVIVLLLAGAAFGATTFKSFRRFWLGTGIVSLIWAFGGYTPFYQIVYNFVPYSKYLRAPSTMIYVTAFSVSVLAALGMERVLARRVSPKYAMGWGIAALVVAAIVSIGGYTAFASAIQSGIEYPQGYGPLFAQRLTGNTGAAILGAWRSFAFAALGAGALWAFLTDRLPARTAAIALTVLLVVDLWSIERLYWTFSAPAAKLFATDPAIEAIKADIAKTGDPARVWTEGLSARITQGDPMMDGDELMVHGIRVVGNYHGNELGMYDDVYEQGNLSQTPAYKILSPQFWRHEDVGYLYTGADDSTVAQIATMLKVPTLTKLVGPVLNAAGSSVFAYKLPSGNHLAWVAPVMVKAPENQALSTVLDPRFDPTRIAIIDSSAIGVQAANLTALPDAVTTSVAVKAFAPGSYDLTLDQPAVAGQALVVSDNYFPGWTATADGKPATVTRTDYNLIGVALPAGARSVQLRFQDVAYEKGKVLTLISILIAVVLLGAGLIADRRSTVALSTLSTIT